MSKQDFMKPQTHILSVNIRCKCNGCERKVKKLLQKIDGVYDTSIDAEQGKVTVTGNVDPNLLIKKLEKSGKRAQIWRSVKDLNEFKSTGQFDSVNSQLSKNDSKKVAKNPKKEIAIQQLIDEMKASKDLKSTVKVKDDYDDDSDDEGFSDEDDSKQHDQHSKKVVHVMVNGEGKPKTGKDKKAKGGYGMMSRIGKVIGGNTEGKFGNLGKMIGGGEDKGKSKGGGTKNGSEGKIGNKGGGNIPAASPGMGVNGGVGPGGPMGQIPGPYQQQQYMPMYQQGMMGGGGGGPMGPYQQPQYMPMVDQQGMMGGGGGGDLHHPAMYGRMPPGYGYYAPPMPPPVYRDPYTNMFSDENPEGCRIM